MAAAAVEIQFWVKFLFFSFGPFIAWQTPRIHSEFIHGFILLVITRVPCLMQFGEQQQQKLFIEMCQASVSIMLPVTIIQLAINFDA